MLISYWKHSNLFSWETELYTAQEDLWKYKEQITKTAAIELKQQLLN